MALGRRGGREQALWVAASALPRSAGHPFYTRLNAVLDAAGFDRFAEAECAASYVDGQGRPSIPPGTYVRMLLVGYFEGIDSQRGIAWRCSDSLALREFLDALRHQVETFLLDETADEADDGRVVLFQAERVPQHFLALTLAGEILRRVGRGDERVAARIPDPALLAAPVQHVRRSLRGRRGGPARGRGARG
jgi:hypothetical protein